VSISSTSGSLIRAFQSLRLDVGADCLVRVHARHAEGDDLFLELDLGAVERLLVAVRLFVVDVDQARVVAQPGQQAVDAFAADTVPLMPSSASSRVPLTPLSSMALSSGSRSST
jgi:hypothetical protein